MKGHDKSEITILVSYHPNMVYSLSGPAKGKFCITRDVIIVEKEEWKWNQGSMSRCWQ